MKIVYTGEKDSRLFKEVLGQTIGSLLESDPQVLYLDADLMNCIGTAKLPAHQARAIDCGHRRGQYGRHRRRRGSRGHEANPPFFRSLCLPALF